MKATARTFQRLSKLAHQNPERRAELLPLLRKVAWWHQLDEGQSVRTTVLPAGLRTAIGMLKHHDPEVQIYKSTVSALLDPTDMGGDITGLLALIDFQTGKILKVKNTWDFSGTSTPVAHGFAFFFRLISQKDGMRTGVVLHPTDYKLILGLGS